MATAAEYPIEVITRQQWLDNAGEALQPAITKAFEAAGPAGQRVKNALHGTWLGHPLHPVLTDIPIGAWTAACVLDIMDMTAGEKEGYAKGADVAVAVGLVGAVGAAVTGITDWQSTHGRGRKIGLLHGIMNGTATLLYGASLLLRKRKRGLARGLAFAGYAISGAAANLGGHLVYGEQIGVDHTAAQELPDDFVPTVEAGELEEGKLTKVFAGDVPVLLVRQGEKIHAIAETCSHLGGPLSEGELVDGTVRCPWHGSRFDLATGDVVDGPATYSQPCFQVRLREGKVEVRSTKR